MGLLPTPDCFRIGHGCIPVSAQTAFATLKQAREAFYTGFAFGLFQAIMPLIGITSIFMIP